MKWYMREPWIRKENRLEERTRLQKKSVTQPKQLNIRLGWFMFDIQNSNFLSNLNQLSFRLLLFPPMCYSRALYFFLFKITLCLDFKIWTTIRIPKSEHVLYISQNQKLPSLHRFLFCHNISLSHPKIWKRNIVWFLKFFLLKTSYFKYF